MSRLADPTLCPDCRALVRQDAVCSGCGLVLTGPLATDLWNTMLSADALVERLRATASGPVAAPAPAPVAATPGPPPFPAAPVPPTGPRPAPLGSRAVPVLLLSLGGILVFTAVSLFLAVTWTILPLAVKALIMVVVTTGLGALSVFLSRKALRGSAEAFWAITAALLALDLSAAHRSGLLGLDALSGRTMTGASGVVIAATAIAGSFWLVTTPIRRSISLEIAAAFGLLTVGLAWFWTGPGEEGAAPVVGFVVLVGVALVLRRRVRPVALAAAGLATLSWLDLVRIGTGPGLEDGISFSTFWTNLEWWPLLVAAALAAVVAAVPHLVPPLARTIAAGGSLGALALLALLPLTWSTRDVLVASGVVLVLAVVARFGPAHADRAAAWLGAVGAGVGLGGLLLTPVVLVLQYVEATGYWIEPLDDRLPTVGSPLSWVALAVAVAVLVLPIGARGHLRTERGVALTNVVVTGGPALVGLAVSTGVVAAALPLWLAVLGFLATVVAAAVPAVRTPGSPRAAAAALAVEAAVLGLLAATRSDLASALLSSALLVVLAGVFVRVRGTASNTAPAVVAAATAAAGYAVATWGLVADLDLAPRMVTVSLTTGICLVAAAWVGRTPTQRLAVEITAAFVAAVAAFASLADADVLAMVLTIVGSALALSSVLKLDRHLLGWGAALVLFVATLVRLGTDHRIAPELYAVPAAALLLVVGVVRLLGTPDLGSWRTLGSGLNLALVPSTLIAVAEPDSWRTVVVILGGAAALTIGLVRHWQSPFLVGGGVLALIALRFLLPLAAQVLANPLGAWMLFGATGSALLVAGVMWEQSVRGLRGASRYVGALT